MPEELFFLKDLTLVNYNVDVKREDEFLYVFPPDEYKEEHICFDQNKGGICRVDFSGAKFHDIYFRNIEFNRCKFSHCLFENCTFDSCSFKDCSFENINLNGVELLFSNCDFYNISFDYSMCGMIRFSTDIGDGRGEFKSVSFNKCKLKYISFKNTRVMEVTLDLYTSINKLLFSKCVVDKSTFNKKGEGKAMLDFEDCRINNCIFPINVFNSCCHISGSQVYHCFVNGSKVDFSV